MDILLVVYGLVIVTLTGFAWKFFLADACNSYFAYSELKQINWSEFAIGASLHILLLVPLVCFIGTQIAIKSNVTFMENINGWETKAVHKKIPCYRDGPCCHNYNCDPYIVNVRHTRTVGSGKNARTEVYYTQETRYHKCPYTKEEWQFFVESTIGEFEIAHANLPENPMAHLYRSWHVPWDINSIPAGYPQFWLGVKDRLDKNNPGPVTKRQAYDNYILPSKESILKSYSASVEKYSKAGLLPKLNSDVHDFYYVDRVSFVGIKPRSDNWQFVAGKFNAALGTAVKGDIRLVIVDANKVDDRQDYLDSLIAYWQSKKFAKNALAKNSIIVVLGSADGGQTVAWAKAATGMPLGNEPMLAEIERMSPGTPLTPEAILGPPGVQYYRNQESNNKTALSIVHGGGKLEPIIYGPNAFSRIHMKKSDDQGGGFKYLLASIKPTSNEEAWILVVLGLLSFATWYGWLYFVSTNDLTFIDSLKENGKMKNIAIILAILAAVGVVALMTAYGIINSINGDGTRLESQLMNEERNCRNYLSHVFTAKEQTAVANMATEKQRQFILDAVKGRYDSELSSAKGAVRGGAMFSAISEAYPNLDKNSDMYNEIIRFVRDSRTSYRNRQSKLSDIAGQYDNWLNEDIFRKMVVGSVLHFPSDNLKVEVAGKTLRGRDALDEIKRMVVTKDAKQAYDTKEMPLLYEDKN